MDTANVVDYDLIVVGSSAGGIEALSILVGSLPPNFPAPMVLAQHLDPNQPSSLNLILQRHTPLEVVVVNESAKLKAGTIYVVPANRHVLIEDSHVSVHEYMDGRPRPSVDLLLETAAAQYGERLIAIILTGMGSDGAAGAIEVKRAGGTVIVQNPRTARFPSMPLALPPSAVDFESDVENIGSLLMSLLTGGPLPETENFDGMNDEEAFSHILDMVGRHSSLDFHAYKKATILRRVSRRMALAHIDTLAQYAQYVSGHPAESSQLVNAFLINVTRFFRDPEAFIVLRDTKLPTIIARQRDQARSLRLWSAGCSTGEEPYSLAILVTELLGAELPEWDIKIFATDVDESAVTFARHGLYAVNAVQGLPPEYAARYFEQGEHGYQIIKSIRQMVTFGQHDLAQNGPFPHLDLIVCRNVLIYFSIELQEHILGTFSFSLFPNGYLFLGKAEMVRTNTTDFEMIDKIAKIYSCIRRRPLVVGTSRYITPSRQRSRPNSLRTEWQNASEGQYPFLLEDGRLQQFDEILVRLLPHALVVIDRSYRVFMINLAARRLLGIHDASDGQDFLHAARSLPYQIVRDTIDRVYRDRQSVIMPQIELNTQNTVGGTIVSLTATPLQSDASNGDLIIISITDVTQTVTLQRQLASILNEHDSLLAERTQVNRNLNEINQKLLEANERMQISNDALILSHEEVQATLEELETTNEELQASNEEMETTNEELQASNEELQTTNDEIRARTAEIQELASQLRTEQTRLTEMVSNAPFYMLILRGPELRVQASNPPFDHLLGDIQLQGRTLSDVAKVFSVADQSLTDLAQQVYHSGESITTVPLLTRRQNADGETVQSYFMLTIRPLHNASGVIDGVAIYVDQDISALERRTAELERFDRLKNEFISIASHELRTPLASILGFAELLQQSHGKSVTDEESLSWSIGNDSEMEWLDIIVHQVDAMNAMVEEMRDVTRLQSGQFELATQQPGDLAVLVRRIAAYQQTIASTHHIILGTLPDSLISQFDALRIEQVLNNLIGNAVKYSPLGKPITISLERRTIESSDKAEAVVSVRDEGYGISEEDQAHLFERFFRARGERNGRVSGLGLGLYISSQIVTRHGGRIWLESTPGVGSTFYFSLPIV